MPVAPIVVSDEEANLVVKRNELIYSQHDLSATAQKMMAALLSLVDSRSKALPKFEFSIRELADLLDVSFQSIHQKIDSVTDELQMRFVTVPVIPPKKDETYSVKKHGFSKFNWFKTCRFDPVSKKAVFIFHEDIEKYVIDITSDFTKYRFRAIKRLNSKYAIRLYELLRRHYTIAEAEKGTVERYHTTSLIDLKSLLSLGGKYPQFGQFENKVLKVAQKELLEKTDITFTYRALERKTPNSRAPVKNLLFTIRANSQIPVIDALLDNRAVFERLRDFFTVDSASRLCGKYSDEIIISNLAYVEQSESSGMLIEDKTKFVSYCLKYDMATNAAALNVSNYVDEDKKQFIKIALMPRWEEVTEEDRNDFRQYGLSKGFVADVYLYWKAQVDDATLSDAVWDALASSDVGQFKLAL